MADQRFCLRWNNHQPNLVNVMTGLLNSEMFVDATIAAEGRKIQVHKVVLSACSSYFQVRLKFIS
ncbi:sex determination protein fruitless-like isoform X2 [Aphis craccivora]|uniref:Sex determination protein fruitless-like isoform X2 n=1 Tax=Aphis craccivora TaxID=307492 RepID=A0A6G0YYC7_APHCR|nr:sex determination protein fruitless-like isoform X2 [Aphis craccivora]